MTDKISDAILRKPLAKCAVYILAIVGLVLAVVNGYLLLSATSTANRQTSAARDVVSPALDKIAPANSAELTRKTETICVDSVRYVPKSCSVIESRVYSTKDITAFTSSENAKLLDAGWTERLGWPQTSVLRDSPSHTVTMSASAQGVLTDTTTNAPKPIQKNLWIGVTKTAPMSGDTNFAHTAFGYTDPALQKKFQDQIAAGEYLIIVQLTTSE